MVWFWYFTRFFTRLIGSRSSSTQHILFCLRSLASNLRGIQIPEARRKAIRITVARRWMSGYPRVLVICCLQPIEITALGPWRSVGGQLISWINSDGGMAFLCRVQAYTRGMGCWINHIICFSYEVTGIPDNCVKILQGRACPQSRGALLWLWYLIDLFLSSYRYDPRSFPSIYSGRG